MLTVSNVISLLRAPLALLFIFQSVKIRIIAIVAAMISDIIDGYLARRFKSETFFGKVLDPLMDKFFVYFAMGALFYQGSLSGFGLFALLVRDISIILYIFSTWAFLGWGRLVYVPAISSKVTTALQFFTLFAIILTYSPPPYIYWIFIGLGPVIYIELLIRTYLRKNTIS